MRGHIRKRGDKYQVAVYLGQDQEGNKKYKYQTFDNKKAAEKALTEILHQINNNTYVDPGKITFGEYLDKWLKDYCLPKLAPKTYKRYEEIVKLHIKPDLGPIPLVKLQPLNLQNHYSKSLTQGRVGLKHKDNKGLSPTTVLFHHRIIHKALEQAVKWQLVGRNVADAVEPPRKAETEFETISPTTLEQLLEHIKENYPVAYVPIVLLGSTGMRRSEVCGLRWKDVNLKAKTISVRKQLQRIKGQLVIRDTKNDSRRSIPIPDYVAQILKQHKAEQNSHRLLCGQAYQNNDLVCCWEEGRPIDPDYLTKVFINKTCKNKKFNINNVRLHDLRHSFATFLLSKKVHPKVVQELLGHSSIGITLDTYSHVLPSMKEEVADLINEEYRKIK